MKTPEILSKLNVFDRESTPVEKLGKAVGIGLLAGLAGTVAITISQAIEMKITGREPSNTPVDAASKVFQTNIAKEAHTDKQTASQGVHWAYGTGWGIARGLLGLAGVTGAPATLAHFVAVWGAEQVMLPSLKLAPPITEEEPETIGIDVVHHAVYALAAGLVYDAFAKND
jgi:hypothetical protein